MLNITKIHKYFESFNGEKYTVIDNINISVAEGEFVCILGPSGCGKSVLLYLIAGFLQPTSGTIMLQEKIIDSPGRDRAMVFQDYVLFPWKTVYGNVMLALNSKNLNKKQKHILVTSYISIVGLHKYKDWYIYKLSGGMQQRVALARALVINPKILLLDEPFSALDSYYRRNLRSKLVKIWAETKKTIILVTHNVNEAIHLADTIYILTTCPATVKESVKVNLPRPRHSYDNKFVELSKKIKLSMEHIVSDSEDKLLTNEGELEQILKGNILL